MQGILLALVGLAGLSFVGALGWGYWVQRGLGKWNRSCDEAALKMHQELRRRGGDTWSDFCDPLQREAIHEVLARLSPTPKAS